MRRDGRSFPHFIRQHSPLRSWHLLALLAGSLSVSCASSDVARARTVAAPGLMCAPGEAHVALSRETALVREWFVGCDFTYTRVHCTDAGCRRAEPKPPCVGDMPCFQENPQTLEWELPSLAAR